jgi:hypothetical protein
MTQETIKFVRRRDDLLFSFSDELMENVSIRLSPKEEWLHGDGVIASEPDGFDFRHEHRPELKFTFPSEAISKQLGLAPKDLAIQVVIEDLALGERGVVADYRLDEIVDEETTIKIDLNSIEGLFFARGFEIVCFIHRTRDAKERRGAWSKSHILLRKVFIAKSSEEEAYFDISWINFPDEEERANVWYYTNWKGLDVSDSPGSDLFCVSANEDLRAQFKRLENNSHFGHLVIRQMVSDILLDIVLTTLEHADLSGDPLGESLHEQVQVLLKSKNKDFDELALRYKQADSVSKRDLEADIKKTVQQLFEVGDELRNVQFGGYRS